MGQDLAGRYLSLFAREKSLWQEKKVKVVERLLKYNESCGVQLVKIKYYISYLDNNYYNVQSILCFLSVQI